MSQHLPIVGIVAAYLVIVLGIGYMAARITGSNREDYFMASRSFGLIVLLFTIFATRLSAVIMVGLPGLAYRVGPSAFGFFFVTAQVALSFFILTVGVRVWAVGKRFKHLTPGQIVNHRYQTKHLGALVTILLIFWTVPYLLLGVQGAGLIFDGMTQGAIPYWLGGLIVTVVVFLYVSAGGMRGTGWTNTFQGIVFSAFLVIIFLWIPTQLGGFQAATRAAAEAAPPLLNRAGIPPLAPRTWFAQGLIVGIGAAAFPHLTTRFMTGRTGGGLKRVAILDTLGIIVVAVPATMIGFWAVGALPDLQNTDLALPALIGSTLPLWTIGLALAAILAAIMSSIDGQIQTLSTMLAQDILDPYLDLTEKQEVWSGRILVGVVLGLAYLLALATQETIMDTATFAFSGFGLLVLPIYYGLYWERANGAGAFVGVVLGFVLLWGFELNMIPQSLTFGFLPFIPIFIVQAIVMVAVSYYTEPTDESRVEAYAEVVNQLW